MVDFLYEAKCDTIQGYCFVIENYAIIELENGVNQMDFIEGIIICNNEAKVNILKNSKKSYKFFTMNSLARMLYGACLDEAIITLIDDYKYGYDLAFDIVKYLPYININQSYESFKINQMKEIKKDLIEKKLFVTPDELDIYMLKNNHITFVDVEETNVNKMIINDIKKLNNNVLMYNTINQNLTKDVYHYETIELETVGVFNEIIRLNKAGIDYSKIKIYNTNSEYFYYFKKLSKLYNLPLNLASHDSILSSNAVVSFLNNLAIYDSFNECIENVSDTKYLKKIINIINKYNLTSKKPGNYIDFFRNALKNVFTEEITYENGIELINDVAYNTDDYIFFMSFNNDSAPRSYKDIDYLSDKDKLELGLDTAITKNANERTKVRNIIAKVKHLYVSYKTYIGVNEYMPSNLIKEFGLTTNEGDVSLGFSRVEDDLRLGVNLDNYLKYKIENQYLSSFDTAHLKFNKYDNQFSGISADRLNEYFSTKRLKLSYSALDTYFNCPFKYYLDKILQIDEFKSSLKIDVGNYAHKLLEESYNNNFNIDAVNLDDYATGEVDKIFLNRMKKVVEKLIEFNKEKEGSSKLDKHLLEGTIDLSFDDFDFTGRIDKLLYKIEGNDAYITVVDYKTGSKKMSIKNIEYGFNLQLPVYLFLLNNWNKFKGYKIHVIGIYLQRVNNSIVNDNPDDLAKLVKGFRLEGYTNSNKALIMMLDPDYKESGYLAKYKLKVDGNPDKNSLVLNEDDFTRIVELTKKLIFEAKDSILGGSFIIEPKKCGTIDSCTNCGYKDICYKRYSNYKIIEVEDDEKEEGDENGLD